MNKKMVMVIFAASLLIISCQTNPVVWDNTYPEGKLTTVRLLSMKIDSYNGILVSKFNWVKIPAGETRLGGDVNIGHAGITWVAKGMEFNCYLEEGKEYIIMGKSQDMQWGVSVYEASNYKEMSEENKVAFIPFKEQPKFN